MHLNYFGTVASFREIVLFIVKLSVLSDDTFLVQVIEV